MNRLKNVLEKEGKKEESKIEDSALESNIPVPAFGKSESQLS